MKKIILTMVLATTLGLCSCGNKTPSHVHSYGNWTKIDDTNHKKVCECGDEVTEAHTWVADPEHNVAPTHESKGYSAYKCELCNALKTEELPKLNHEYVHHDPVTPTTEKTGNIEYYSCSGCAKLFVKENGEYVEKTLTEITIPVLNQYTVSFETNGGTILNPIVVTEGTKFGDLSIVTPSKEGYDFVKWELVDGKETKEIDKDAYITDDVILSAKWSIKEYTVTLVLNNGEPDEEVVVTHGTTVGELPDDIELEGATFNGWYSNGEKLPLDAEIVSDCTFYAGFNKSITLSGIHYIEIGDSDKVQAGLDELYSKRSITCVHEISDQQSISISEVSGSFVSLKYNDEEISDAAFASGVLTFGKTSFETYGEITLIAEFVEKSHANPKLITTLTINAYVCDFAIRNADDLDAMQYVAHKIANNDIDEWNFNFSGHFVLENDITYNDILDKTNGYNNTNNRMYKCYTQGWNAGYGSGGFNGTLNGASHNIKGLVMSPSSTNQGYLKYYSGTGLFTCLKGKGNIRNLSLTKGVALGEGFLVGAVSSNDGAYVNNVAMQLDYMEGSKGQGTDWLTTNGAVESYEGLGGNRWVSDVFVKIDSYNGNAMAYGRGIVSSSFYCVCDGEMICAKANDSSPVTYCKDYSKHFSTYAEFKNQGLSINKTLTKFWDYMNNTYVNYTIKFMNGAVELQNESLEYGQLPVYKGETPVSPNPGTSFTGWDKEITNVSGDQTYYAKFENVVETKQAVFNRDISAGVAAYRTASGNSSYLNGYTWDENYASFDVAGIGDTVTSVKVGSDEKLTDAVISGSTLKLPMDLFLTDGSSGTITVLSNESTTNIKHVISYVASDFVVMNADDLDAMQYVANKFTSNAQPYGAGYIVLGQDITYNTGAAVTADKANGYANLRQYDTIQGSDYWTGGFDGTFNGLGHNIEGLVMKNKPGMTGLFYIVNSGNFGNYSVTHGVALGHGFIVGRHCTGVCNIEHIAIQLDYLAPQTSSKCAVNYENSNGMFCHPSGNSSNFYSGDFFVKVNEYGTPGASEYIPYVVGPYNPSSVGYVVPDMNIRLWNTNGTDVYASEKPTVTFTSYTAFKTGSTKYGKLATICSTFWTFMNTNY